MTAEAGAVLHRDDRKAAPAAQQALIGLEQAGLHPVRLTSPLLLKALQLSLEPSELTLLGRPLLLKDLLPLLKAGRLIPDRGLGCLNVIEGSEDLVLEFRAALLQPFDLFQNGGILLIRLDLEETSLPLSLLRRDIFQLALLATAELFECGEALAGLIPRPPGAVQELFPVGDLPRDSVNLSLEPGDLQIEILQIDYLSQVLPHASPQFMDQGSWFMGANNTTKSGFGLPRPTLNP